MADRKRVLVLCTGNSARSQMAEGFLRTLGWRFEAHSAGTEAEQVPRCGRWPRWASTSRPAPQDLSVYDGQEFDLVITVCNSARQPARCSSMRANTHWTCRTRRRAERRGGALIFRAIRDGSAAASSIWSPPASAQR